MVFRQEGHVSIAPRLVAAQSWDRIPVGHVAAIRPCRRWSATSIHPAPMHPPRLPGSEGELGRRVSQGNLTRGLPAGGKDYAFGACPTGLYVNIS